MVAGFCLLITQDFFTKKRNMDYYGIPVNFEFMWFIVVAIIATLPFIKKLKNKF